MTDTETPVETPPETFWRKWGGAVVIGGLVAVAGVVAIVAALLGLAGSTESDTADDLEYGAFTACTSFVEDILRAPSTASFPNYFEPDGEVIVTQAGDHFVVSSHVDAENGFGGMTRTDWRCTVLNLGDGDWQLEDMDV